MGKAKQSGKGKPRKTSMAKEQSSQKAPKQPTGRKPSGRRTTRPIVSPLADAHLAPVVGIPDQARLDTVANELSLEDRDAFAHVQRLLAQHLGSHAAVRLWLISPGTGFETTALDAVRKGQAKSVLATLEAQWGPSPIYA